MSAWSNWIRKFCFIAALVVPIALSDARLPVSAQGQQGQQQPQQPQQQQTSAATPHSATAPATGRADCALS